MEKNDERIRPLVFSIPRGEVQGVDDLIPRDGSLVSEVLLVSALVNPRLGLSLHDANSQSGKDEDGQYFHGTNRLSTLSLARCFLGKKLFDRAGLIDSVLIQAKVEFAVMLDGITADVEQGCIEVTKGLVTFLSVSRQTYIAAAKI